MADPTWGKDSTGKSDAMNDAFHGIIPVIYPTFKGVPFSIWFIPGKKAPNNSKKHVRTDGNVT